MFLGECVPISPQTIVYIINTERYDFIKYTVYLTTLYWYSINFATVNVFLSMRYTIFGLDWYAEVMRKLVSIILVEIHYTGVSIQWQYLICVKEIENNLVGTIQIAIQFILSMLYLVVPACNHMTNIEWRNQWISMGKFKIFIIQEHSVRIFQNDNYRTEMIVHISTDI